MAQAFILTLSCPDRVGIVARLARLMEQHDCFIVASRTFGDPDTGRFFARLVFNMNGDTLDAVMAGMQEAGEALAADWQIRPSAERMKVLLLVSKSDH